MSSTPILTLSSGLPFSLAAKLLTEIETVLETYGAQRIRIDPASRLTTVLAELSPAPVPAVDVDPPGVVEAGVSPMA